MPEPRSVLDPDARDYEAMIQRHKKLAAERERLRQGGAVRSRQIAGMSNLAGEVVTAAELGPAGVALASGAAEDIEAARFVARVTGPLGKILSTVVASESFKADRAEGMPLDEALIEHGGGLVTRAALGSVGGWAGASVAGPFGLGLGAYVGEKDGEFLAQGLAHGWRGAKDAARRNWGAVRDGLTLLERPPNWRDGR